MYENYPTMAWALAPEIRGINRPLVGDKMAIAKSYLLCVEMYGPDSEQVKRFKSENPDLEEALKLYNAWHESENSEDIETKKAKFLKLAQGLGYDWP